MLQAGQKKVFSEVMFYYFETSGSSFDEFVDNVTALKKGELGVNASYKTWLLSQCIALLDTKGIPIDTCIESKDVVRAIAVGEQSRQEGEFYTPEVWCKDGRDYMKKALGDIWGEAIVWDGSCGTGNLMRTSGYNPEKLYLSSLLAEDVSAVKALYTSAPADNVFQFNFLDGIDYDEYNHFFLDKLPESLKQHLLNDDPIVFYMNPPYKTGMGGTTDVAQYMTQIGFGRSANDIYNQFLERVLMIRRTYKLTNCYLGVFGPTCWMQSNAQRDFYEHFTSEFKLIGGMSFPASDFNNVGAGGDWLISFTIWQGRAECDTEEVPVLLDARSLDQNGVPQTRGTRLLEPPKTRMADWVKPADVLTKHYVPAVSSALNFSGNLGIEPTNAIAHLMSDHTVINGMRHNSFTTYPNSYDVPVTAENFYRCVASFSMRCCANADAFIGRETFTAPNEEIDGYAEFVANSIPLVLFNSNSYMYSYRDVEIKGEKWDRNNNFFPLTAERVRELATDEKLINDLDWHECDNSVMLSAIEWAKTLWSADAQELYDWGIKMLEENLMGTSRAMAGYKNWTQAYDSCLMQVRSVPELWDEEKEKQLRNLTSKLRSSLSDAIFKFGCINGLGSIDEDAEDTEEVND